jgi:hypothetical protein
VLRKLSEEGASRYGRSAHHLDIKSSKQRELPGKIPLGSKDILSILDSGVDSMKPNYAHQIIALWTVFLLALLFHTDLGLMPLFHGQNIAHAHDQQDISWILWLMLAFFIPPLLAIILPTFTDHHHYRVFHFWLTVIYSILNFAHLVADLLVSPIAWYQIALMTITFLIGLLLNLVAHRWMTRYRRPSMGEPWI